MTIKEILAKKLEDLTIEEKMFLFESKKELTEEQLKSYEGVLEEMAMTSELKTMLKGIASDITIEKIEEVKKEIKTWIAEQKDAKEKNVGLYNKDVKEKRKYLNDNIRALAKAIVLDDDTMLKEMSTDATGTPFAGYAVDRELSAEIRVLTEQYGVARAEMMNLTLSKNSYLSNELSTDLAVMWVDEGAVIKSSQIVLGRNGLSLKKLGVFVSLTRELIEDEEIDLFSFMASRVAENFAEAEDEAFFNGDGSATYGGFTGLLKQTTTVNITTLTGTTFASITADDFLSMMDDTPKSARDTGKFYMHHSIMSKVRKLKDNDNNYIYQRPSETGPATLWGKPVVEVEVFPQLSETADDTAFVLFGDLRLGCIFGEKGGMVAERFNTGTIRNVADNADLNLLTTDRQAIRFIERVGYAQVITKFRKPITLLKTNVASV